MTSVSIPQISLPNQDALAWWLSTLSQQTPYPLFILARDNRQATQLQESLAFFAPSLKQLVLPDWETLAYDQLSPTVGCTAQRLLSLTQISTLKQGVLIAPVTAALQRLAPRSHIEAHTFQFSQQDTVDFEQLQIRLAQSGYQRVSQVTFPGEFAVRGSILDIFPLSSPQAFRLDMDADTIDSLRYFDPELQQAGAACTTIQITPAGEFPLSEAGVGLFKRQWQQQLGTRSLDSPIYQRLSTTSCPPGIEYYLPLFFEKTYTLLDYLPAQTHCIVLEAAQQQAQLIWQQIQTRYEQRRHDMTWPLLPPEQLYQTPEKLIAGLKAFKHTTITLTPTPATHPEGDAAAITALPFGEHQADALDSEAFKQHLNTTLSEDTKILFCAQRPSQQAVLVAYLQKIGVMTQVCTDWAALLKSPQRFHHILAPIHQGFRLTAQGIAIVPDHTIFGLATTQPAIRTHPTSREALALRNITELQVGMYAVHRNHGIGQYLGLENIQSGDYEAEFITLAYAEDTKLYVPVSDVHLISHYSGQENPPLHALHTERWQKTKQKALTQLRDVAAELLDIYAQRAALKGFAFTAPDADYQAFVAGFGFEETPDQITAIQHVIQDLCSDQPMDRLICGDVGFGKTEVAMRAAFMVLQSGKQVAVLTPTTLLAEQHYRNFRDRFADWPVRIEWLSRFRSRSETQTTLTQLAQGKIDIIIGTHALLGKQIVFHKLGLVIVDEEHHFGVQQKERLKNLKKNVDVLTLTATPIPRTLQMALSGLRELSIIATPPQGRLAIQSRVTKRDHTVIREAILREFFRGGQVYFVHNHIATLDRIAKEILQWVPEARIAIAHGQLPEHELEARMADFYQQHCNILICTAIIETGLDIPTANTLIVDRADHFGLAQLHQLRGRVGRARHQAYAYFLVSNEQTITADAVKRLDALGSLGELGAGFSLASHDLDIRGAGELLGDAQSGAIKGVGFSLYMELLEQTIEAIKNGQNAVNHLENTGETNPTLELHLTALLPRDYLPDISTRLRYYKRITQATDIQALNDLQMELIDRYGLLPEPAKHLFLITELKWQAKALGIRKIEVGAHSGKIEFNPQPNIHPVALIQLIQSAPHTYRLKAATEATGGQQLHFKRESLTPAQRIDAMSQLLSSLSSYESKRFHRED